MTRSFAIQARWTANTRYILMKCISPPPWWWRWLLICKAQSTVYISIASEFGLRPFFSMANTFDLMNRINCMIFSFCSTIEICVKSWKYKFASWHPFAIKISHFFKHVATQCKELGSYVHQRQAFMLHWPKFILMSNCIFVVFNFYFSCHNYCKWAHKKFSVNILKITRDHSQIKSIVLATPWLIMLCALNVACVRLCECDGINSPLNRLAPDRNSSMLRSTQIRHS